MTIKRQQIFRLASKMLIACFVLAGTPSFATDFFDSFEITSIYEGDLPARSFKAGIPVDSTKIDDPDYYLPNTKFGAYIKTAYEKLKVDREEVLHNSSISYLPKDLKLVRRSLQIYMKETSNQSRKRDDFYVGNNGNENGREFNFSELGLPQRITRIALCFGFDPFVFASLIKQESQFYRYASSVGKATGFVQMTSEGIEEVSEQLGILDDEEKAYHGKDADKIFRGYIDCYLGGVKSWKNIWEDLEEIPKGRGAYMNNDIGLDRVWKYQTLTRKWLNEDSDRNLIYGAVQFKLYLGRYGNYTVAKEKYNVGQKKVYVERIKKYYKSLVQDSYKYVSLKPELVQSLPDKVEDIPENTIIEMTLGRYSCTAPLTLVLNEFALIDELKSVYDPEESRAGFAENLKEAGYCRDRAVGV